MSEFNEFRRKFDEHMGRLTAGPAILLQTDVDPDELWALYLSSFPGDSNPMFRKRTEHDCSACRQFVKRFGHVVRVDEALKITTAWDVEGLQEPYATVCKALAARVRRAALSDIFVYPEPAVGIDVSHEENKETGAITAWKHLFVKLPAAVVKKKGDIPEILGKARERKQLLERALTELKLDAVEAVLELVEQNSLYRGDTWLRSLTKFREEQRLYGKTKESQKQAWLWVCSLILEPAVIGIRNTSIGTLLVDLSAGTDLDEAVRKYEAVVAPANYRRPKPVFTQKMLADAKAKVEELGLLDSLPRRFARLEDITVNNVLFADRDAKKVMTGGDPFGALSEQVAPAGKPMDFSKVESVPIADFIGNYLEGASGLDLYLEGRHAGNLVSLIAPEHPEAKPLFAWGNNFSWAYAGNVADAMKERVKAAGGCVDGALRFSIQWNEDGQNNNDLDAHAKEPGGNEILYWNRMVVHPSSGRLDVDIIDPRTECGGGTAVENIVWTDLSRMPQGTYTLFVNCYNNRGGTGGFRAQVEANGVIHDFSYTSSMRTGQDVVVATVKVGKGGTIEVVPDLKGATRGRKIWGLDTPAFHPVSVLTRSPNWWNRETPVGNGHYLFMLRGCTNPDTPNGFFNEYLPAALNPHRKVFEALGSQMKVKESQIQLSGVGFASTKRNELIVRVRGKVQRVVKVLV